MSSNGPPQPSAAPDRMRRIVLVISMLGGFMAYLDATIVNLAFPAIGSSFPAVPRSTILWVLDGYFIVGAAFLVPSGYLADRMGRKRLFISGLALFTGASGFCAIAPSAQVLIAARVLQALGASAVGPASLSLLLEHHLPSQRTKAVALWSAGAGAAAAVGPSLGGALISNGSWRLIFLINIPIGLLTLWIARRVPESRQEAAPMPDLLGGVLVSLGVGALTFAIVESARWGWGDARVVAGLVSAVASLVVVVARGRRHPAPIIDFKILGDRKIVAANVATVAFGMAFYGLMLGNVLFLTTVWRYSVFSAGLAMTPGALMAIAVAISSARLAARYGQWPVACGGLLLISAGTLWYLLRIQTSPDYLAQFLPGNLMTGTGLGLAGPMLGGAAVTTLAVDRFGIGSAFNATARQLGGALGVAIVVALLGAERHAQIRAPYVAVWTFGGLSALIAGTGILGLIVLWTRQPHARSSELSAPQLDGVAPRAEAMAKDSSG